MAVYCFPTTQININYTICNEHHEKYPIHDTLAISMLANFICPLFGVLIVMLYYRMVSLIKLENSGGNVDPNHNSGTRSVVGILTILKEERLSPAKKRKYDKIFMILSHVCNCLRATCCMLWYYGELQDNWEFAFSWCVFYPTFTGMLYIGNVWRLAYGKFECSLVFAWLVFVFVLGACDAFLICVGFTYLHHVTNHPIPAAVILNRE